MGLRHLIQYLRTEHQALLNLATRLDKLLTSAAKNDFAEHSKSLPALRSLERGFLGVVRHCSAQDRDIESTYLRYLKQEERARIAAEHKQIIRTVTNFREELKFATADRTMAMVLPGMDVVNRLRSHISYERELLGRIMELAVPPRSAVKKKESEKRTYGKHTVRRKPMAGKAEALPYTLELHPEL